jgi:hypothetical protein
MVIVLISKSISRQCFRPATKVDQGESRVMMVRQCAILWSLHVGACAESAPNLHDEPQEESKGVSAKKTKVNGPATQLPTRQDASLGRSMVEVGSSDQPLPSTEADQALLLEAKPQPTEPLLDTASMSKWTRIRGKIGQSKRWGSGWLDLSKPGQFLDESELRIKVGGSADCIVVRLLAEGMSPELDVGIIDELQVPADRVAELKFSDDHENVVQVSVHGAYAWAEYCSPANGPATMIWAEVREPVKKSFR